MLNLFRSLVLAGLAFLRTRHQLAVEILALRHQLGVLGRSVKRPRLTNADRGLWVLLSRRRARWSDVLIIVKPATIRELLGHVIVMNECHLQRLLRTYESDYYHSSRTHLSLDKDSPEPRAEEPPESTSTVTPVFTDAGTMG